MGFKKFARTMKEVKDLKAQGKELDKELAAMKHKKQLSELVSVLIKSQRDDPRFNALKDDLREKGDDASYEKLLKYVQSYMN